MHVDAKHPQPSTLVRHRLSIVCAATVLAYGSFVHYVWGWGRILADWGAMGFDSAFAVIGLLVCTYIVRAWRVYDYFPRETSGRFVELFHLTQVHNLLNIMLPFRSGETSFPILMRTEFSVPLLRGASALIVMRTLDLHSLFAAVGLGLALAAEDRALPLSAWFIFMIAPIPAFLINGPAQRWLRPRLNGRLLRMNDGIMEGLPNDFISLVRAWMATVVNWSVKVFVFAWALGLMGVAPLAAAFGGALGGELSSVLPFHAPAGIGTYPAAIVAGAVTFGSPTTNQPMSELVRASISMHLMLILAALIGTLLALLLNTVRRWKAGSAALH